MQWGECGPLLLHSPITRKLWSMVFGLFRVSWVMPKRVVEVLATWQGWFGRHWNIAIWKAIPHCLIWCTWREDNVQSFEYW